MAKVLSSRSKAKCNFCGLITKDKYKFGEFYQSRDVYAHYFCILLSSHLVQKGEDHQGIQGFLLSDIKNELRRQRNVKCVYCNQGTATIYCCKSRCKAIFHFPCGLNQGSLHEFYDHFYSYCPAHRPLQKIPEKILTEAINSQVLCAICFEPVNCRNRKNVLWAPCCTQTWYHKQCIQKLAFSAGYFFKCAICNNSSKFLDSMRRFGVYIPQKDASWELEPNAYEELLFKYSNCDAEICKCPDGRQKNVDDTIWQIIVCMSCGSQGVHVKCGGLRYIADEWECNECKKITSNCASKAETSSNRKSIAQGNNVPKKRRWTFIDAENSLDKRKKRKTSQNITQKSGLEESGFDYECYLGEKEMESDDSEDIDVDVVTVDKENLTDVDNFHQCEVGQELNHLTAPRNPMRRIRKSRLLLVSRNSKARRKLESKLILLNTSRILDNRKGLLTTAENFNSSLNLQVQRL